MAMNRRFFLKSGAVAVVGLGMAPRFVLRASEAIATSGKTVVVVFQRGAADGLNIVVPHAERAYYRARPTIAIPRPKAGDADTCIDLDGRFGLHPAMASLKPLWDAGTMAAVHAAGSPDSTRSHFDAQDFMESGTPGTKSTRDGWLNRYMQDRAREDATAFRAVSMTGQMPRILAGRAHALAIPELRKFAIEAGPATGLVRSGLDALYGASDDALLASTARETLDAVDVVEGIDPRSYRPAHGAKYPGQPFGADLRQVAQLIKADLGVEIAFVETTDWDHHSNEGAVRGQLANRLRPFADGIAAFVRDMGDRMNDVVLVTMSEFGRTAAENGSRGTDHGHANVMLVAGAGVGGGKVYGDWPGLEPEQLYEGRDLALTTDYRDVVGEVLARHLGAPSLDAVFPGYGADRSRWRNVIPPRS